MSKFSNIIANIILLIASIAIMLLLLAGPTCLIAHGSTSKPRPNSLGVDQIYSNPNVYLFAVPMELVVIRGPKSDLYTVVRFAPYNTMALYDENVMFCGDVSRTFRRVPSAITYNRRAHRMYDGLACHELEPVFEIKVDEQ